MGDVSIPSSLNSAKTRQLKWCTFATFRKLIKTSTIYYHYHCSASLFEITGDATPKIKEKYYDCHLKIMFETVLEQRQLEFNCLSNEILADIVSKDKNSEFTWVHKTDGLTFDDFAEIAGFELVGFGLMVRSLA